MASLHLHLFASIVLLLVSSSLRMAQAERHKQVASANSHCNINCVNDGYCSFTKYTDYPQQGDIGYYKACTCRPGFGGGACEKVIEECQAPHFKCHNGAPCETQEDGSLGCECSFADAKSEMAGYMCRRPVMQECNTLDEDNKSFCTNGGMCLSSMTASSKHLMFSGPTTHEGCQCNDAFSGDHCEFLNDMPESSLALVKESGKSAGAKAGITLSVFAALAAFLGAIFVVHQKRRQRQAHMVRSCNSGEQRFRNFFLERCASKNSMAGDDVDTGFEEEQEQISFDELEEKEVGDLQSMLFSVDDREESGVYEAEPNSDFV